MLNKAAVLILRTQESSWLLMLWPTSSRDLNSSSGKSRGGKGVGHKMEKDVSSRLERIQETD